MQNPSAIRTRTRTAAPTREIQWGFMLLAILCAGVIAAGFFFAARQHFTSMEFGLKNSSLREQLRGLEAEKQRLLLAREVASSPVAIRKAAKSAGLTDPVTELQPVLASAKAPVEKIPNNVTQPANKEERRTPAAEAVRTVMTAPVQAKTNGETRTRVVEAKDKKDRSEVAAVLKFR